MPKETVIVGAGIGGLVTALLLSREPNRQITIYEKGSEPGGRLRFERHGEYKIDQGPTIVLLPHMLLDILEEGGIPRHSIPLMECDPLYDVHFHDGTTFTKYADLEQQREELKQKFPGEEEGFSRFLKDMHHRFLQGKAQFLDQSFVNKKTFFSKKNLQTLFKLKAYQHVRKMMEGYFQDPRLVDAYALQTLYIGGHPDQSPALYSLVSYSEHEHGIWYLKGGYASLVDIIVNELEQRGVRIVTNAAVSHINVRQKKVEKIELDHGEHRQVDEVILNGDFPLMDKLMPENYRLKRRYTSSSGCLLIYLGLDRIYNHHTIHQFYLSKQFKRHMEQVFDKREIPEDPSFYTFHPSIIDPSLAPEGKSVLYVLVPVPSGSDINWSMKDHLVDQILSRMEENGFPNLREHIDWKKVRTPDDALQDGLFEGGSFGIAPTLFQSGVFRPQLQPYALENVYAVGASIHPGGGVPIVMQGARLLANHLQKDSIDDHNYKRGV